MIFRFIAATCFCVSAQLIDFELQGTVIYELWSSRVWECCLLSVSKTKISVYGYSCCILLMKGTINNRVTFGMRAEEEVGNKKVIDHIWSIPMPLFCVQQRHANTPPRNVDNHCCCYHSFYCREFYHNISAHSCSVRRDKKDTSIRQSIHINQTWKEFLSTADHDWTDLSRCSTLQFNEPRLIFNHRNEQGKNLCRKKADDMKYWSKKSGKRQRPNLTTKWG